MSELKRGRKAIEVTSVDLQNLIQELESKQPDGKFANRSNLWAAVENSDFAKQCNPRPLSGQVAMMLAKKHNVLINTPVGQRGRQKGCGPVPGGGRKKKAIPSEAEVALRKYFPLTMVNLSTDKPLKNMKKTLDKVIGGSLKAAIKLKCLECTNIQPVEVRNCTCLDCPLWSFRPYKN